jgi:hypothetical protein
MAYDLNKFKTASPAQVNYDFVDIANGTGYETYYLIESEDSGGKDYHLTPQTDYSNSVMISITSGASPSDIDYDLSPFVFPRTINGTALISLSIRGSNNITPTYAVYLYRWDGTTETQLGTAQLTTAALTGNIMLYFRIDIDNEIIPAGQQLRCRVVLTNATGTAAQYGIDPAGRTDAGLDITTQSKIHIPYKLDL